MHKRPVFHSLSVAQKKILAGCRYREVSTADRAPGRPGTTDQPTQMEQ